MRGPRLLLFALLAAGVLAPGPAAVVRAEYLCVQLRDARNTFVCSPPRGQMVRNVNGKYVCGPGRCVTLSNGGVVCSAVPGGAIAVDTMGRPVCFGGCVNASGAMCVIPVADER